MSTVVVVTRYKNGPQLGTGGLARAYGTAARECLRLAEKVPYRLFGEVEVTCSVGDIGVVYQTVDSLRKREPETVQKISESFESSGDAVLRLSIPLDLEEELVTSLRNLGKGRIKIVNSSDAAII